MAIAVLPLLLAKGATCKHKEFVEFISVSVHSSHMCNSEYINLKVNYFHDSQIWNKPNLLRGQYLLIFYSGQLINSCSFIVKYFVRVPTAYSAHCRNGDANSPTEYTVHAASIRVPGCTSFFVVVVVFNAMR